MNNAERRTQEYLARIEAMRQGTKAQKIRYNLCMKYLYNFKDDGRFGRIDELMAVKASSSKTRVAKQGKNDIPVRWDNGTREVNRPAEYKTNGGRIEELIDRLEEGKDKLFVYKLDYTVKHTVKSGEVKTETRQEEIICYFSQFYSMLLELNAIKLTGGKHSELAIQPSSKKMYERLLEWPIPFDPYNTYCEDDFEGLEM